MPAWLPGHLLFVLISVYFFVYWEFLLPKRERERSKRAEKHTDKKKINKNKNILPYFLFCLCYQVHKRSLHVNIQYLFVSTQTHQHMHIHVCIQTHSFLSIDTECLCDQVFSYRLLTNEYPIFIISFLVFIVFLLSKTHTKYVGKKLFDGIFVIVNYLLSLFRAELKRIP